MEDEDRSSSGPLPDGAPVEGEVRGQKKVKGDLKTNREVKAQTPRMHFTSDHLLKACRASRSVP